MNTAATIGAYGVEELSPAMAMEIEGGISPFWEKVLVPLIVYTVENADQLVKGVVDGWNAYEK